LITSVLSALTICVHQAYGATTEALHSQGHSFDVANQATAAEQAWLQALNQAEIQKNTKLFRCLLIDLAEQYKSQQDFDKAAKFLVRYLQSANGKESATTRLAMRSLATVYDKQRKFSEANEVLQALVQQDKSTANELINDLQLLGENQLKLQRREHAVKTYRKILSLAPSSPKALIGLGDAVYIDDAKEAEGCYRRALQLTDKSGAADPLRRDALVQLSALLKVQKRYTEAKAIEEKIPPPDATIVSGSAHLGTIQSCGCRIQEKYKR
jgi:tetratricopeptide (TPR) repeat protein